MPDPELEMPLRDPSEMTLDEVKEEAERLYDELPEQIQDPINAGRDKDNRVLWTSVSSRPSTLDIVRLSDEDFAKYTRCISLTSYWMEMQAS